MPGTTLTLQAGVVLTLGEETILSCPILAAPGLIDGSGRLRTICEVLSGNIAPTVRVECAVLPFDAVAVNARKIRVTLPTRFFPVDLRRRAVGTDNWVVLKSANSDSVVFDLRSNAPGGLRPNVRYEYQWRPSGSETWSASNVAWLTQSFGKWITVGAPTLWPCSLEGTVRPEWGILSGPVTATDENAVWRVTTGTPSDRRGLAGPVTAADEIAVWTVTTGIPSDRRGLAGPVTADDESAVWTVTTGTPLDRRGLAGPVTAADESAVWTVTPGTPSDRRGLAGPAIVADLTDALTILKGEIMSIHRNQTPTFTARIQYPSGAIMPPDLIEEITYAVRRVENGLVGQTRIDVTGHVDIPVPATALLEFPVNDSFWNGMQASGEDASLVDPEDAYAGIRIVVAPSAAAGEFDVAVYDAGNRVSLQTTDDAGLGSTLTSVTAGGGVIAFNPDRTAALSAGIYDLAGGDANTAAAVANGGEAFAAAQTVGTWPNFTQTVASAGVRGYNFKHTPNTRIHPAFPENGTYEVQYKLTPFEGNPVVVHYPVEVVE